MKHYLWVNLIIGINGIYLEELFVVSINPNIVVKVQYILIQALKLLKKIATLCIILTRLTSNLQYLMA